MPLGWGRGALIIYGIIVAGQCLGLGRRRRFSPGGPLPCRKKEGDASHPPFGRLHEDGPFLHLNQAVAEDQLEAPGTALRLLIAIDGDEEVGVLRFRDTGIGKPGKTDLDGDGKKEILAATSRGMVVALDHACRKAWVQRLECPPEVLKWAAPEPGGAPWIFVGCEDGSVIVLDGGGNLLRHGRVSGKPTCIEGMVALILLATDRGEVKGFQVGP